MSTPLSAKNSVVRVAGQVCPHTSWNITPTTEALDSADSESGGFDSFTGGFTGATIDLEFNYDDSSPHVSTPLNLAAGATIGPVLLYVNGVGSKKWTAASVFVAESPHRANIRELHKGTAQLKVNGSFTFG